MQPFAAVRIRLAGVIVSVALLFPAAATAQTEGLLAIGGSLTRFGSTQDTVGSSLGLGVLIRLKPRDGWGPTIGLGWYDVALSGDLDGSRRPIGRVRLRPIMVGYGYTRTIDRIALYGGVLGGYASNSARLAPSLETESPAGEPYVLEASDALVAKPTASLTYSVTPRLGLVGSAAVVLMDPRVRLREGSRELPERWRLITPTVSVGLVYSIF